MLWRYHLLWAQTSMRWLRDVCLLVLHPRTSHLLGRRARRGGRTLQTQWLLAQWTYNIRLRLKGSSAAVYQLFQEHEYPTSRRLRVGYLAPRQAEGGPTELWTKRMEVKGELQSKLCLLRWDHSSFSTRNLHANHKKIFFSCNLSFWIIF